MSTLLEANLEELVKQLDDQTCQATLPNSFSREHFPDGRGFLGANMCGAPATWVWLFTGCPHEWMVFLCEHHHLSYGRNEPNWMCLECSDYPSIKIVRRELK